MNWFVRFAAQKALEGVTESTEYIEIPPGCSFVREEFQGEHALIEMEKWLFRSRAGAIRIARIGRSKLKDVVYYGTIQRDQA